jgi:hypothetical protein
LKILPNCISLKFQFKCWIKKNLQGSLIESESKTRYLLGSLGLGGSGLRLLVGGLLRPLTGKLVLDESLDKNGK